MKSKALDIPAHLVKSSALTSTQIDSLMIYRRVASGELTLEEAAKLRRHGPVRIGSFYRTVNQGRRNISESVVTLTIALWLGFIKAEEVRRLLEEVGKELPDIGQYEIERLAAIVEKISSGIVI